MIVKRSFFVVGPVELSNRSTHITLTLTNTLTPISKIRTWEINLRNYASYLVLRRQWRLVVLNYDTFCQGSRDLPQSKLSYENPVSGSAVRFEETIHPYSGLSYIQNYTSKTTCEKIFSALFIASLSIQYNFLKNSSTSDLRLDGYNFYSKHNLDKKFLKFISTVILSTHFLIYYASSRDHWLVKLHTKKILFTARGWTSQGG